MKTFKGGVHLPYNKEGSLANPIKKAPIPDTVVIPFLQHIGKPAKPLVKAGDKVKRGTKIGEADGFISANIHSSISGTVKKIDIFPHPVFGSSPAVLIESDGEDAPEEPLEVPKEPPSLPPENIVAVVKEAGIVGLGGAAFPTHVKLSPPPDKPIDTVIINAAECEPYLTCDHMTLLFKPKKFLLGVDLIRRAVRVKRCYIGIESNKMDAAELLMSKVKSLNLKDIEIVILETKYPQGAEKQLIKAILNREVPSGGLPMDVGVVVQNVGTALAIYNAVYKGEPLYERMLTVCGKAVKEEQNIIARIGIKFDDAIKSVGGYLNHPLKVVMGGPMMGVAVDTVDVPVIKGTSGILTFIPNEFYMPRTRPCIRCGRCVDVCSVRLIPNAITIAVEAERYLRAESYGINDCIECGCCAYVCPAKRNMVQIIRLGKDKLRKGVNQ